MNMMGEKIINDVDVWQWNMKWKDHPLRGNPDNSILGLDAINQILDVLVRLETLEQHVGWSFIDLGAVSRLQNYSKKP